MLMLVPPEIHLPPAWLACIDSTEAKAAGYDRPFDGPGPRCSRVSHVQCLAVAFLGFHSGGVNLRL